MINKRFLGILLILTITLVISGLSALLLFPTKPLMPLVNNLLIGLLIFDMIDRRTK